MQEQAFDEVLTARDITFEEATVRGRVKQAYPGLTAATGAAKVNGPAGDKGQYIWMGTYVVQLDRGLTLNDVPHLCLFGSQGAQDQRCIAYGERVVISWLNRKNIQVPVILEGVTLGFYNKQLIGGGHLIDPGERIIRSAMARDPGATVDAPFGNNQFDDPHSAPDANGVFDENSSKVVKFPGAESFYDKFGRLITLSRNPANEFLITCGKTDTGQDEIAEQDTIDKQDAYFDSIADDESEPANPQEPYAPKPINLYQYQLIRKRLNVVGDNDPARSVVRGILPRFDRWKFQPIVIRSYQANSAGQILSTLPYATHQERQNTTDQRYGFVRTITDGGDVKLFVPRHVNSRVVGDTLLSFGGAVSIKVKATDRLADGSYNTDDKFKAEILADGTTNIMSKQKIVVDSADKIYLGGEAGAETAVKGDTLKTLIDSLYNNLKDWVPVAGDGAASLKALLLASLSVAHPGFITAYTANGGKYLSVSEKVKVA